MAQLMKRAADTDLLIPVTIVYCKFITIRIFFCPVIRTKIPFVVIIPYNIGNKHGEPFFCGGKQDRNRMFKSKINFNKTNRPDNPGNLVWSGLVMFGLVKFCLFRFCFVWFGLVSLGFVLFEFG